MSEKIPLKERIEQFQHEIGNAVDNLDQINSLSRKLLELPVERLGRELEFISELLDETKQTVRKASVHLFEGIEGWGETSFSTITSTSSNASFVPVSSSSATNATTSNNPRLDMVVGAIYETQLDPDFEKLLGILTSVQDKFQLFKTPNIAKGKIGESLCHTFLPEIMDSCFFLEGQTGLSAETTTEDLAYQTAKEFLSKNSSIEYAIASRPFSGGDPYSVDSVLMLINRKDVENWEHSERSTANYLVFESKTDKSQLSKAQRLSSYVEKQAKYMENNTLGLEDRHQLGKDLLQANSEERVIYAVWHLDIPSGKIKARRIS